MESLRIVATLVMKEQYKNEFESIFASVMEASRKEAGCISYDLYIDVRNPLRYIILEEWRDEEAIKFHNGTSHFAAFQKAVEGKTDDRSVEVIRRIM